MSSFDSAVLGRLLNEVQKPRAKEQDICASLVAARNSDAREVDAFMRNALGRTLALVCFFLFFCVSFRVFDGRSQLSTHCLC